MEHYTVEPDLATVTRLHLEYKLAINAFVKAVYFYWPFFDNIITNLLPQNQNKDTRPFKEIWPCKLFTNQ